MRSLGHPLKVASLPAPASGELPHPESFTPGQAGRPVCQGRKRAGIRREHTGWHAV